MSPKQIWYFKNVSRFGWQWMVYEGAGPSGQVDKNKMKEAHTQKQNGGLHFVYLKNEATRKTPHG